MSSCVELDPESGKPDIVNFYNKTKGGVDTFDQLCHTYTTSRKTRRWPLRVFYGILDQCAVNSLIVFTTNNIDWRQNSKNTRRSYLHQLSYDLVRPHIERRRNNPHISGNLCQIISQILGDKNTPAIPQAAAGPTSKRRCHFCPRAKDRKTAFECFLCKSPTCGDHRAKICENCRDPTK